MTIASDDSVVEEDMTMLSRIVTLRGRRRRRGEPIAAAARDAQAMPFRPAIEILPEPMHLASKNSLRGRSMAFGLAGAGR